MKKVYKVNLVTILVVFGMLFTALPAMASNQVNPLPVFQSQGDRPWCWAYTAKAILLFFGINKDACQIVGENKHQDEDVCCQNEHFGNCWEGGSTQSVFNDNNFEYTRERRSLSFNEVMDEIDSNRPISVASFNRRRDIGHAMSIWGYNHYPLQGDVLIINNPWYDHTNVVLYNYFLNNYTPYNLAWEVSIWNISSPFSNGDLLRNNGPVYVIQNNKKRHIGSMWAFDTCGFSWSNVEENAASVYLDSGPSLTSCMQNGEVIRNDSTGAIYYVQNDQKRWIGSMDLFNSCFDYANVRHINPPSLIDSTLPSGPNLTSCP